jgi:hypothetical protein
MKNEYPPNELEALRPIKECNAGDELMFLNFTSALNEFVKQRTFKRNIDPRTNERRLYDLAVDLYYNKLTYQEEFDGERKWNHYLIALLPEKIPLGNGTSAVLTDIIAVIRSVLRDGPPPSKVDPMTI